MTTEIPPATERRGQLRRADKIMTAEEVDAFLSNAFCGRTATIGADGYPYVVPNLFVWHQHFNINTGLMAERINAG